MTGFNAHQSNMGGGAFKKSVFFFLLVFNEGLEKVLNRNDDETPQSEPVGLSSFLGSAGERWDENTEA